MATIAAKKIAIPVEAQRAEAAATMSAGARDALAISQVGGPQTVVHETAPVFEFSRNGKGEPSWTIKLSTGGGAVEKLEEIVRRVLEIDKNIPRDARLLKGA